jgi:hypothetical protein
VVQAREDVRGFFVKAVHHLVGYVAADFFAECLAIGFTVSSALGNEHRVTMSLEDVCDVAERYLVALLALSRAVVVYD